MPLLGCFFKKLRHESALPLPDGQKEQILYFCFNIHGIITYTNTISKACLKNLW